MKKFWLASLVLFFLSFHNALAQTSPPPKLILALVVDQLRADQLIRGREGFEKGGFEKLLSEGAVFPFAEHLALQNMTCPGHAMILTGSLPARNGIALNEWLDPEQKKEIYCVGDPQFGLSPRRLQGDTLGDEIRMRWPTSKTVGVALKDRASILLAGHAADAAYWFDHKQLEWRTSPYYTKSSPALRHYRIPGTGAASETGVWNGKGFSHSFRWDSGDSLQAPWGVEQTFAVAEKAFEEHRLAQGSTPDLLAVSLSGHDLTAHLYGPESDELEDLLRVEDHSIARFLDWLDHKVPGGLSNVWILLTADHGGATPVERARYFNLDTGRIDARQLVKDLNRKLRKRFGACNKADWIYGVRSFNFYLDPLCFKKSRASHADVEGFIKTQIKQIDGVAFVVTRNEIETRRLPPPPLDEQIRRSFVPAVSGDVILIPKPFWYEASENLTTHMTSYSYDRLVPLVFWGQAFRRGRYAGGRVIDAAPTLAFALQILPPALSEGQVLEKILKQAGPAD